MLFAKNNDFYLNKKVIIVGPSKSIEGGNKKNFIEDFDIVVRVNWQWPISKHMENDLGSRMDVLYHCSKNEPYARSFHSLFDNNNFKKVKMVYYISQQRDGKEFESLLNSYNIPHKDISLFCKKLKNKVCKELNTGYVAIEHLILKPIKELYVLGFSFHQEPYYEGYCEANWWDSNGNFVSRGEPEILLKRFIEIKNKDERIKVDEKLGSIIKKHEKY